MARDFVKTRSRVAQLARLAAGAAVNDDVKTRASYYRLIDDGAVGVARMLAASLAKGGIDEKEQHGMAARPAAAAGGVAQQPAVGGREDELPEALRRMLRIFRAEAMARSRAATAA